MLAEIPYFSKYLHYGLLVPLWFINLWVVEKLLEDGIYYSLVNLNADALEFIPYLLGVLEIHDIEVNLSTYAFSDDPLCYIYHYMVFLNLFGPQSRIFAWKAWPR